MFSVMLFVLHTWRQSTIFKYRDLDLHEYMKHIFSNTACSDGGSLFEGFFSWLLLMSGL